MVLQFDLLIVLLLHPLLLLLMELLVSLRCSGNHRPLVSEGLDRVQQEIGQFVKRGLFALEGLGRGHESEHILGALHVCEFKVALKDLFDLFGQLEKVTALRGMHCDEGRTLFQQFLESVLLDRDEAGNETEYKDNHISTDVWINQKPIIEMSDKPVRVYSDGVFDGFHRGHARQLKQAKKLFPNVHLLVGVCAQDDVEKYKGPTIFSGPERAEMVEHCKYADEVIYPGPWLVDEDFLTRHNIDFVAHDDIPYVTAGVEDAYATCKKLGKFKATQRT